MGWLVLLLLVAIAACGGFVVWFVKRENARQFEKIRTAVIAGGCPAKSLGTSVRTTEAMLAQLREDVESLKIRQADTLIRQAEIKAQLDAEDDKESRAVVNMGMRF